VPALDLQPVLTLKSRIELVQRIKKGATVSYGGTWRAERDSVIGIVPVGYGDGYPRAASNKAHMLVGGRRAGVAGLVCMDYTMLDLTDAGDVKAGDEVVIIGEQGGTFYGAEDLAEACSTISYEILTRLGPRIPRQYLHEGA
jgi:alanine racemase